MAQGVTLGEMIERGSKVRAWCDTCRGTFYDMDLVKLAARVGADYSLWNRRSPCRRAGCSGWIRFYRGSPYIHGLWDDTAAERWSCVAIKR